MIESTTDKLLLEQQNHTLLVTLNNPSANTWDQTSLVGLKSLISAAAQDSVSALVITGGGAKFFSAGADLKQFSSGDKSVARAMAQSFGEAFEALAAFPGVTIAAINGYAMGGGLECALACDIRIAEEQAILALPEASVGLLPCGGGTQNLTWLVGEAWAKRIILCGERLTAKQGLDIGLVEQLVPTGEALPVALALAEMVANQSPLAVTACKKLINSAREKGIQSTYSTEREAFVALFDTEDQQEGVHAFFEKRPPKWRRA